MANLGTILLSYILKLLLWDIRGYFKPQDSTTKFN